MSYLILKDLEKKYTPKGDMIVKKINLSIQQGEFLVLLGPSGCGKTTTLRMISGLEQVTGGDILLDGKSIVHLQPKDRGVSMIFQSYAVWPHMTVYDNIAYALKLRKMKKEEIKRIVYEVAEISDIVPYLKRYPTQLSGGQRQRVAVARALAVKPKLFLMDEPLSNLDAKLRVAMRTELKQIHMNTGSTSIFVTHDQSEAMSLADRIVIMRNGTIEQIGTPQEVYHASETMFVASFIGTPPTNFIPVWVEAEQERLFVKNEAFSLEVTETVKLRLRSYVGKEVILGIRPENFILSDRDEISSIGKVKVEIVEPQGSYTIIFTHVGNTGVKIMSTALFDIPVGREYYLQINPKKMLFFDTETEQRIQ